MNAKNTLEQFHKKYPFLTGECIADLEETVKFVTLKKKEQLVREGQYASKTFFILKGSARTFYLKDGKDITDWFAFENEFICSVHSFFLNTPSQLYIEVLEETSMLEITKDNFYRLSKQYPSFDQLGKLIVTQTILQLQQRIIAIQFETAEQKLKNLLSIRHDILKRVQLTYIASYLGITLETLSRLKNRSLTQIK